MRCLFGDQKFLNTMDTMKQYNEITEKMCGEMEGILQTSLDLDKAEKIIKERIASGSNFSDPTSQNATKTTTTTSSSTGQVTGSTAADRLQASEFSADEAKTPKVPICFAEDVIGQAIFAQKGALEKANNGMVQNYNRFISDISSQLQKADQEAQEKAYNKTGVGKVLKITDEEDENVDRGGTQYFTQTGC